MYLYSPLRVKYPYIRGALLDLWKQARANHADPVDAWKSLVENPESRQRWQRARGKGGLRRTDWATALEIISALMVQTIKKHGPDRIAGFSPIPAMSMISYAAGARLMQLIGGISLSFYDWYCDLPPASPETWGEQTDVAESADWYHARMLVSMGANIGMTRTPDCHFLAEGRHNGTKLWVFSPEFNMVAKYADEWVAVNAGLLATCNSLPSGVIRAFGGWLSDKFGARSVMYWVLGLSLICCLLLIVPHMDIRSPGGGVMATVDGAIVSVTPTEIVLQSKKTGKPVTLKLKQKSGELVTEEERAQGLLVLPRSMSWHESVVQAGQHVKKKELLAHGITQIFFQANIWIFTVLSFILGAVMGIGKAAVYKHIPDYFPADVGLNKPVESKRNTR